MAVQIEETLQTQSTVILNLQQTLERLSSGDVVRRTSEVRSTSESRLEADDKNLADEPRAKGFSDLQILERHNGKL